MVERKEPVTVVARAAGDGKPYQVNARTLFAWVGGMILWAVICSAVWFVSTRGDYANLAIARACYSENSQARSSNPECASIERPDTYMNEVNRKARISGLVSALGGGAGIVVLLVTRRRKRT